ncbi:hypothetical protein GUITHDRAFT_39878, partial [Guillardia theta CCMP2712]
GLAERVRLEVETHINLDHPSVVEMYTYFEDDHSVYLVLELCEGGELYRFLHVRKLIPEDEAAELFRQIVTGIEYLHSHNIAHRDLKLSNLLLTSDKRIKISDFGLSIVLNNDNKESETVCGTPNYMSPEVISRSPHGLASDVWSLGCLLYSMIVGCPPFERRSVKETLERIAQVDFSFPDFVSPLARDLIGKLIVKDPSKRLPLSLILDH